MPGCSTTAPLRSPASSPVPKRAGLVRSDLDVQRAARLFLALNDGLVLQYQTQPDKVDPQEYLGPMADMIVGYLTGETRRPEPKRAD